MKAESGETLCDQCNVEVVYEDDEGIKERNGSDGYLYFCDSDCRRKYHRLT